MSVCYERVDIKQIQLNKICLTNEVIMGAKADPIRAQNEQNPSSRFCIVVGKSSQVQM